MIIYGGVAKSTESPPSKRNRLMTREIHFQTHARARRSQTLRRTRGPAVYCDQTVGGLLLLLLLILRPVLSYVVNRDSKHATRTAATSVTTDPPPPPQLEISRG